MKKSLLSLAMLAALGMASGTASAAFLNWTVNETVVPGEGGVGNPSLSVNNLTGKYSELLGFINPTTFSASAVGTFSAYAIDGTPVTSLLTGAPSLFTQQYKLYALFTATGAATSPTTFVGTGGSLQLWLDPLTNTSFSAPGGAGYTDFTAFATAIGTTASEDMLIGTSNVSWGTGDLIGPPGAFNIFFDDFALTAFGSTYWTNPSPFHLLIQTNGDIDGINPNPVGGTPPFALTGDFSAGFAVPEPGSLALLGLGLAGLGMIQRRRNAAK